MGENKGNNKYVLHIFTGSKLTAGTDANVLITLYGEKGESGEQKLDNTDNNFERNKEDVFNIPAKDLGKLSKVKIGHDNSGGGAAWFLDKVLVEDAEDGATYEFACDRWLADDEDDNQIVRELECTKSTKPTKKKKKAEKSEASPKKTPAKAKGQAKGQAKGSKKEKPKNEGDNKYVLHIFTGGTLSAGTDANVLITLYGEKGESGEQKLDNTDNNFERNKEDIFNIKAKDLGKLSKVKIGHDNSGGGPAWYLDKVLVEDAEDGATYEFACYRWLADDEDDNQIVRELECSKSTKPTKEKKKKEAKGKGKGQKESQKGGAKGKKDDNKGDNGYVLHIFTGGKLTAGTDANVLITLYGEKGESGEQKLDNLENNFERNKEDIFNIKAKDLGKLSKIKIGHDNSGGGPAWFLDKVLVEDAEDGATYEFACDRWLADDEDDNQIVRELECSKSTKPTKKKEAKGKGKGQKESQKGGAKGKKDDNKGDNGYVLHIFTGGKLTAGTDANVLITLYGEKGESGEQKLDNLENNFERNKEDIFNIKAKDLGKLSKIKIGHDNSGGGPAWFLDKVLVEDAEDGATYEFACDRWLADDEDDNQIVRELECSKSTKPTKEKKKKGAKGKGGAKGKKDGKKGKGDNGYAIHIFTGGKLTAGTDANVLITLYGEKGESGEQKLDNTDNNFERNKEDVFNIKAQDLGKLSKITIGHDNSGPGPAWFLDKVMVEDEEDGATYTFACDRWFADDEDDNQIVRDLECTESTEPTREKKGKKEAAAGDDEEDGGGAPEEEESDEDASSETSEQTRRRYFEQEFTRLKESLEKEATRIVKPEFKDYSPFIFSSLEPYHNTYTAEFILDYPDYVKHGYITRKTAIGLVDPEVSHRMDIDLDTVPPSTPMSPRVENPEPKMTTDGDEKEGSTRLPKWPVVEIIKSGPMTKEKLNWADVPKLREELRTKYSSNAQERRKKDYQRTKQDWTRMELQKLKEIHEVNRSHMQVTCTTYLGTSVGGKAAVKSLAKVLE